MNCFNYLVNVNILIIIFIDFNIKKAATKLTYNFIDFINMGFVEIYYFVYHYYLFDHYLDYFINFILRSNNYYRQNQFTQFMNNQILQSLNWTENFNFNAFISSNHFNFYRNNSYKN